MNIKDFRADLIGGKPEDDLIISAVSLEDILLAIKVRGIDELAMGNEEMLLLVRLIAANIIDDNLRLNLLKEGKIDKYYGIKLILK